MEKNKNIEVLFFKVTVNTIRFEYYNNKIRSDVYVLAEVGPVEKWAVENNLTGFVHDSEQNGEHIQKVGEWDPNIWVREIMTAEDFIKYLTDNKII